MSSSSPAGSGSPATPCRPGSIGCRRPAIIDGFGPFVDLARPRVRSARVHDPRDRAGSRGDRHRRSLAQIPEVLEVHKITGPGDLLCRIVAAHERAPARRARPRARDARHSTHEHVARARDAGRTACTRRLTPSTRFDADERAIAMTNKATVRVRYPPAARTFGRPDGPQDEAELPPSLVAMALALIAAACGSSSKNSASGSNATTTTAHRRPPTSCTGSNGSGGLAARRPDAAVRRLEGDLQVAVHTRPDVRSTRSTPPVASTASRSRSPTPTTARAPTSPPGRSTRC